MTMTTTADLRAYLDAHGVDGAPTEPGWYVVTTVVTVIIVATMAPHGMVYAVGCEHSGRYLFAPDITRHAPLLLAPPAGRDLDAEVVAGLRAGRMAFALPDADVRVEVYQHRSGDNRSAEGVILVHTPTGARAECHKHASRHKNKAAAMDELKRAEAVRRFCLGELLRGDLRGLAEKAGHD